MYVSIILWIRNKINAFFTTVGNVSIILETCLKSKQNTRKKWKMVSFIWKIKSDIDSANPFSFPQTIKFCNTLLQSTGNRWKFVFYFQARNKLQDYKSVISSFVSFCYQMMGDGCICLLMCVILRSLATHLAPSLH